MTYFKQACSCFTDKKAEPDSDLASDLPGHCPDYLAAVSTSHLAPQIREGTDLGIVEPLEGVWPPMLNNIPRFAKQNKQQINVNQSCSLL